jgi:hypothetical protein
MRVAAFSVYEGERGTTGGAARTHHSHAARVHKSIAVSYCAHASRIASRAPAAKSDHARARCTDAGVRRPLRSLIRLASVYVRLIVRLVRIVMSSQCVCRSVAAV